MSENKKMFKKAKRINMREYIIKRIVIAIIFLLFLLTFSFLILSLAFSGGGFSITLDPGLAQEGGIIMYENLETKDSKLRLQAKELEYMDNISINWLPQDIDEREGGSHNGTNYIAHTFYLENTSSNAIEYWYEVQFERVTRNVDEALRIMIIKNGERTVYAKVNSVTGEPEPNTTEFFQEKTPVLEIRENFKPGDIDKITLVVWIEGDDPDCVDSIIGGEAKMHMKITQGSIEQDERNQ